MGYFRAYSTAVKNVLQPLNYEPMKYWINEALKKN